MSNYKFNESLRAVDCDVWAVVDYKQGQYFMEGVALEGLVEQWGSPLYVYSASYIKAQVARYRAAAQGGEVSLHYAVKANANLSLLRLLAELEVGFDVVSVGEIERVMLCGGRADKIIFSGVGKSEAEIVRALEVGIGCFNVESAFELQQIMQVASRMQRIAPIALRVNPNVDAKTHPYISTGLKENKFGVPLEEAVGLYELARDCEFVQIKGVGCHIGSQITTLEPFLQALDGVLELCGQLQALGIAIEHVDMGGGLGVCVAGQAVPSVEALVSELLARLQGTGFGLQLQPGRSLVGNAGVLLTQVLGVKDAGGRRFVVVDAGMNDYIRPALYQAYPQVKNLSRRQEEGGLVDVVGPVCESADVFVKDCRLEVAEGDRLMFSGVGAYGMAMAGQYNSRLRPAEVLVEDGQARLIRRRDRLEDLWAAEIDV